MAAGVAGDAYLRFTPERLARLAHGPIVLPEVDAVGFQPLGERDAVVDDEGDVARAADRLQRLGEPHRLMLVHALDAELERGDRTRLERALQPLRKVARDVERRDQVELARRTLRSRLASARVVPVMSAHPTAPVAAPAPIRIGCSGWIYKHWRGLFYPQHLPVKRWFDHYADEFDTVEINNSFYRLPKPQTFDAWRERAPPGFRYAVKANRFLTQAKKLKDCAEPLERMMTSFRHLGEKLGPILYQLPPRFRVNPERLRSFLELVPKDVVNVFEFRDKSWHVDEVFTLLESHGASFCAHDMPAAQSPRTAVGPIAYVRFHGGLGQYWGRYTDEALLEWSDWIVGQARAGRPVWAYFNNDAEANAVHDAQTLRAMVRQSLR